MLYHESKGSRNCTFLNPAKTFAFPLMFFELGNTNTDVVRSKYGVFNITFLRLHTGGNPIMRAILRSNAHWARSNNGVTP